MPLVWNISGVFMKIDVFLFYRPHAANTAYVLYFVDTNANQTTMHCEPFFRGNWHGRENLIEHLMGIYLQFSV